MWSPAWPRSPCLSESLRHSERDQATPGLEVGEGYLWYYKCSGEKISKTSWGARSSWIDSNLKTERQNKNQKNLELLEQLGLGGSSCSSWFPCLISWTRPCGHHPLYFLESVWNQTYSVVDIILNQFCPAYCGPGHEAIHLSKVSIYLTQRYKWTWMAFINWLILLCSVRICQNYKPKKYIFSL